MYGMTIKYDLSEGTLTREGIETIVKKGNFTPVQIKQLDNYIFLKQNHIIAMDHKHKKLRKDLLYATKIRSGLPQLCHKYHEKNKMCVDCKYLQAEIGYCNLLKCQRSFFSSYCKYFRKKSTR